MPPKRGKRLANGGVSANKRLRRNIDEAEPHEGDMVIITVDILHKKKTFVIEKETIIRHSRIFAGVLARRQAGSGAHDVSLSLESSEIFNIFRHFVTTGQIFSAHQNDRMPVDRDEEDQGDYEWGRLADAWVLGEQVDSCSFKDAVVDAFLDKMAKDAHFPIGIQNTIYPCSKDTSAIRKLVVDMVIWGHDEDSSGRLEYQNEMPRFYYDLTSAPIPALEKGVPVDPPYAGKDTCKYHEHEQEGKPCYKTMF